MGTLGKQYAIIGKIDPNWARNTHDS
jgi:hypothetical protein